MFFFSFLVWHILSTIQIWNCTYYNTKGKWEEKHSFAQRSWVRGILFFFCLFYCLFFLKLFLGRVEQGSEDDKRKQTIYKEPECKGMHISTNFVDFQSLKYNCSLEQWNVKWLTQLNRNFIYIPVLCYQKWGLP